MMIEHICAEPDIYRIEVPLPNNPLRYLNSYVVRGRDRFLVIDTGFNRPECREALFTGLDSLRVDLARTDLFLTHLHADHTGLVGDFARAGSRIFMHHDDYQYLVDSTDGSTWRYAEEKFMVEGMPPQDIKNQFSNQARKYSPDPSFTVQTVHDGERILLAGTEFQVIHTPGHTKGLCCLYIPDKEIIFTSDHILFDITPNIQYWYHMPDALERYLQSLDKVYDLPVRLALPGHRKGDTSIASRIDALRRHHASRLDEVLQAAAAHPGATAFELASCLSWSMRGRSWAEFPPTQKWFAMGETLAHIEYLLHHGQLIRREIDGTYRYYTV